LPKPKSETRRRTARSDRLKGFGSGWLVSVALHGALLWIAGALVVHTAETEPDEVVTRLDLRPMLAADRPAGRTLEVLPDAPAVERNQLPVFADDVLVLLDATDASSRDEAIEQMLVLEAATNARLAAPRDAYSLDALERDGGPRASGSPVRLPHGPGRSGKAGAREQGTPVAGGSAKSGHGNSGTGLELPPQLIAGPAPDYPESARRRGEEGDVRCRIEVDVRGAVVAVTVLRSSGFSALDEAARAGLLAWRFQPATSGGAPRACIVEHVVTFRLVRVDSRS
jgi:TonB family protein